MSRQFRQRGFTLVELMLATILGSVLVISALGILYDSIGFADVLRTRTTLNTMARESFDMLLDGGITGSDAIYGLRGVGGSIALPAATSLRSGFRPRLNTTGAATALLGSRIASVTIECTASGEPIPACLTAGNLTAGNLTVDGYLGGNPTLYDTTRSISDGADNRTTEMQITLFSAYNLNRADASASQSVEVYRTIFTLNLD